MIQINVHWHKDKKAKNDGTSFLKQSNYVFIPDLEDGAPNFIKQGYDYLKTLDEYKDAIDIKE
ncbi:hypothetical protein [Shouchella clausii]|uniref:hypothetical protein n=1 Tax=Shouchella clausii TaxID=79880 RepID=UPI000BA50B61|nr:hypothetical protein [Shouchella clausii]PAD19119.1 hypothetical protein CHH73_03390 [Shouchella clausii]